MKKEPNEDKDSATTLTLGVGCIGEIGDLDKYYQRGEKNDTDYFKFEVVEGKRYRIHFNGYMEKFEKTSLWIEGEPPNSNGIVHGISYTYSSVRRDYTWFLSDSSGTYYIRVGRFVNKFDPDYQGDPISDTTYEIMVEEVS